jgi:hypothetical protein
VPRHGAVHELVRAHLASVRLCVDEPGVAFMAGAVRVRRPAAATANTLMVISPLKLSKSAVGQDRTLVHSLRTSHVSESKSIGPQIPRPKPVRVRLQRINASYSRTYPPLGEAKAWWNRLKAAMGTTSSEFVSATLFQLQTAARLPNGGISEIAVNAALSMIESAQPKDEIEAALFVQMTCTHTAAMAVLSRVGGAHGGDRHVAMMAAAASKLLRAYALQVETLRRLRAGGSQFMRIEHVHIESNAQAVIGNVQNKWKGQ